MANTMGTFSLVATGLAPGSLGVCVSTAVPAVGSVVPHAEFGIGAIATQGYTNVSHGVNGLKLLQRGLTPQIVLNKLLKDDPKREMRQISIIDPKGEKTAFTGKETIEWKGHLIGENCVAAGNSIMSQRVLESMVKAFEDSMDAWLAERLMQSLEAGQETGGDRRGKMSACLLVVEREAISETRPYLDLRVDVHVDPVKELRRIFEVYKNWAKIVR